LRNPCPLEYEEGKKLSLPADDRTGARASAVSKSGKKKKRAKDPIDLGSGVIRKGGKNKGNWRLRGMTCEGGKENRKKAAICMARREEKKRRRGTREIDNIPDIR